MFRPLSIFIGTRYTRAKRRNRFVSFISMTSMIGLALGARPNGIGFARCGCDFLLSLGLDHCNLILRLLRADLVIE